jgi:hypothetical protein
LSRFLEEKYIPAGGARQGFFPAAERENIFKKTLEL